MKCIYCLRTEKTATFKKREHVIPSGLGTFEPRAFILRGHVCDGCNKRLGDELDIVLSRDSIEGIAYREKYSKPLNKPKGRQRVKITLPFDPKLKDFAGLVLDKDLFINNREAKLASQVKLFRRNLRRPVIFLREELEEIKELNKDDYDLSKSIVFPLNDEDETYLIKLLNKKGIPFTPTGRTHEPAGSRKIFGFEGLVDRVIKRAIAKIAFNYACVVYPQENLTDRPYKATRQFISRGKGDLLFKFPKQLLGQESERTGVKTHGILIMSEVDTAGTLVVRMRLYDLHSYEIPIGVPLKSLPPTGYFMKPGSEPKKLTIIPRGSGIEIIQADYHPIYGPFYRKTRL